MSGDITGQSICNSCINTSKSKMMFSFSRAPRFPKKPLMSSATEVIYSLPEVRSKRTTTMGYGNKYDFTKDAKSKSPVFYDYISIFDQKHPRPNRFTFGVGRENMLKDYDKNVPGPGKYTTCKPFGYDAPKFTIKGGGIRSSMVGKSDGVPGPGTYKPILYINPQGKFQYSKYRNVSSIDFSKNSCKRFTYGNIPGPSPQDYPQKQLMGRVFDSRYRSYEGIKISGRTKNIDSRDNYPGPGAYVVFSEFGIYGKNPSTNTNNEAKNSNHEEASKDAAPGRVERSEREKPKAKKEEKTEKQNKSPAKAETKVEKKEESKPKVEEKKEENKKEEDEFEAGGVGEAHMENAEEDNEIHAN